MQARASPLVHAMGNCSRVQAVPMALLPRLTEGAGSSNFLFVRVTFMKRWQLLLLIFELALFAAILVLPQVALPDFTFHDGTAPVAAHARVCQSGPGAAIAALPQALFPDQSADARSATLEVSAPQTLHSRLSRLCVLIC